MTRLVLLLLLTLAGCTLQPRLGADHLATGRNCYRAVVVRLELDGIRPHSWTVGNCLASIKGSAIN